MQRIIAHAIGQLGQALDVPDGQIAPLADFQRARFIQATERACRFARDASRVTEAMTSSTVSRNSVAAMFMVISRDVRGEEPGLQSVAMAIFTPCLRNKSTGGLCVSRMK